MSERTLFVGDFEIKNVEKEVNGEFTLIEDEEFYKISNYNEMQPFFITLASDSDHWMYISSTGGVTAGRKNPDSALFPYYTDDKIHESSEITGSKTIMHVLHEGKKKLWEPFSERYQGTYSIERNIYKNTLGNKLLFEEANNDLGLTFRYCWANSEKYGWVKKSEVVNISTQTIEIEIVDGLQNLLPHGATRLIQTSFSTLVDAYKKNELIIDSNLALYRMESIPVDKAEPSEALKVTTVWTSGIEVSKFLLSSKQLNNFRNGIRLTEENESKGVRGAFFINTLLKVNPKASKVWYTIAELNQDAVKLNNLIHFIAKTENPISEIEEDIKRGGEALKIIVAEADGLQSTQDKFNVSRHYSNVLFNVMRGGIYSEAYTIESSDFEKHVKHFNKAVWKNNRNFFEQLPEKLKYTELNSKVLELNNKDLERLALEYLPLTFSRRHGDPSRPWNLFSIDIKEEDGSKKLAYQGNWRDIFQNWEALSYSFPEYISGIIAKFVNATSADGYNPYRITRNGIDWEIIDPDDPWSNIGYWGDHQIIYLLKLMEVSQKHFPQRLASWLNEDLFAFANIPYRLKSYKEILANPQDSITFDSDLHFKIEDRVNEYGADAKLLPDVENKVVKANLTEKLLATFLAKMSNFIPEAGIWMNTLRPEWNDANNALVGFGVSMVTLYYMRRFVVFVEKLLSSTSQENYSLSGEMTTFLEEIQKVLAENEDKLDTGFDDIQRKQVVDSLGTVGENYRTKVYNGFGGSKMDVSKASIVEFLGLCKQFIDQSITANKRPDGMYNAYNLMNISDDKIGIRYLYEMLEGQVAAISSGKFLPEEVVRILDNMRASSLYREDQESFILYPDKTLPAFLEKNNLPEEIVRQSSLLKKLVDLGNKKIIAKDINGVYHFNGGFSNAGVLKEALEELRKKAVIEYTEKEEKEVLDVYEQIFDHQSFTGRSGSFYKYEGLGSIYWHMVSKLLLAVGEYIQFANESNTPKDIKERLIEHYDLIKKGIGAHKSPKDYGSFPFDAYSHTPMMSGVQQPGMTGQVKEDIISRFMELGVEVKDGQISFNPSNLKKNEFFTSNNEFHYIDLDRNLQKIDLQENTLAFTYCQVPVIYYLSDNKSIKVHFKNGFVAEIEGISLDSQLSKQIFNRTGEVNKVEVFLNV